MKLDKNQKTSKTEMILRNENISQLYLITFEHIKLENKIFKKCHYIFIYSTK